MNKDESFHQKCSISRLQSLRSIDVDKPLRGNLAGEAEASTDAHGYLDQQELLFGLKVSNQREQWLTWLRIAKAHLQPRNGGSGSLKG